MHCICNRIARAAAFVFLALAFHALPTYAGTRIQILSDSSPAIVLLGVRTADDLFNVTPLRFVGFLVSRDGYVVTPVDLPVANGATLVGYVGEASGIGHDLRFVARDAAARVALWKIEQTRNCRQILPLSLGIPAATDSLLMLGLTDDRVTPVNLTVANVAQGTIAVVGSIRGSDRAIFGGAPLLNGEGAVVGMWQGAAPNSNVAQPITTAAAILPMLERQSVKFSAGEPIGFEEACYASCRVPSNGIERWAQETPWNAETGWVGGGHTQPGECDKLRAAAILTTNGPRLDIQTTKTWETSKKDVLGHVEYKYFCSGVARAGPTYKEARSAECGLWSLNGD